MRKTHSQITYDQIAPFYRKISIEKKNYLSSIDKIIFRYFLRRKTLVDLGSGDGIRIYRLARRARINNITLVDNSDKMIEASKKIPGAKVVKSSILVYLPKEKFDIATCLWNVLGHLDNADDIRKTILNIDNNILKRNGVLILDVNNRYNVLSYGIKQVIKNVAIDLFGRTKYKYTEFYKKVGKKLIKMRVHFFTPYEIENYLKHTSLKIITRAFL